MTLNADAARKIAALALIGLTLWFPGTAGSAAAADIPVDKHGLPLWEIAVFDDRPVRIELDGPQALRDLLAQVPVASFDRSQVRPATVAGMAGPLVFEPRVTEAEAEALARSGYVLTPLPDLEQEGRRAVEAFWAEQAAAGAAAKNNIATLYYPTHAQIGTDLAALADARPDLARTFTWGHSVQGRELWGIVISDDVQNSEPEPEVRLSSSIHGDEVVDMVLLWNLARYLVENYGQPGYEDVTQLVDETEIHIMPLYNPDGYANSSRVNYNGVDLNRNFLEPAGTHSTLEIENQQFVDYSLDHHFVVSQNGHGGSLVVNYPWDFTYTLTPDNDAIIKLSLEYSTYNEPMYTGMFTDGITNGAEWYVVTGSLQDWSYYATDCIDVTIEVGTNKWPAATTLDGYWTDNVQSLLHFIKAAHYGVHGVVTDAETGAPLDATVTVAGIDKSVSTDPDHGDYYKLLPTGTFEVTFTAEGYYPRTFTGVATTWGTPTVLDAALAPIGPVETVTLFSCDFEGNLEGWNGGWGLAEPAEGHDSSNCENDSPGTDYPASTTNLLAMAFGVDLTEAVSGQLSFWAHWEIEADYDACFLETSLDHGDTWNPIATQYTTVANGQGVQLPAGVPVFDGVRAAWVLNTVDLQPFLGQADFRMRLRMVSDGSIGMEGFFIDDVKIQIVRPVDLSPVPPTVLPVAAVRAWPNPFNPQTTVAFTVPAAGRVRLAVYDLQGRRVRTLVDEPLPSGDHRRTWDGLTDGGARAASGVYLLRLETGTAATGLKLTLLK